MSQSITIISYCEFEGIVTVYWKVKGTRLYFPVPHQPNCLMMQLLVCQAKCSEAFVIIIWLYLVYMILLWEGGNFIKVLYVTIMLHHNSSIVRGFWMLSARNNFGCVSTIQLSEILFVHFYGQFIWYQLSPNNTHSTRELHFKWQNKTRTICATQLYLARSLPEELRLPPTWFSSLHIIVWK